MTSFAKHAVIFLAVLSATLVSPSVAQVKKGQPSGSWQIQELTDDEVIQCSHSPHEPTRDRLAACQSSQWIGVCEYLSYEQVPGISYHIPPQATFRVVRNLKGPEIGPNILVNFEFAENPSTAPHPYGWRFGPDKMPPQNSQWILFVPALSSNLKRGVSTYLGSYGRLEATEENIAETISLMQKKRTYKVKRWVEQTGK